MPRMFRMPQFQSQAESVSVAECCCCSREAQLSQLEGPLLPFGLWRLEFRFWPKQVEQKWWIISILSCERVRCVHLNRAQRFSRPVSEKKEAKERQQKRAKRKRERKMVEMVEMVGISRLLRCAALQASWPVSSCGPSLTDEKEPAKQH